MTGQLTQFGANRAVAAGVGNQIAATSAIYLALATALPATPGTATLAAFAAEEITTGGYSRQAVTWGTVTAGTIPSSGNIIFGPFSADPPNVTHAFLTDTSIGTTGNVMAYWQWTVARDVESGDSLVVGSGDLTMNVGACP
jgi:hypothetical protein